MSFTVFSRFGFRLLSLSLIAALATTSLAWVDSPSQAASSDSLFLLGGGGGGTASAAGASNNGISAGNGGANATGKGGGGGSAALFGSVTAMAFSAGDGGAGSAFSGGGGGGAYNAVASAGGSGNAASGLGGNGSGGAGAGSAATDGSNGFGGNGGGLKLDLSGTTPTVTAVPGATTTGSTTAGGKAGNGGAAVATTSGSLALHEVYIEGGEDGLGAAKGAGGAAGLSVSGDLTAAKITVKGNKGVATSKGSASLKVAGALHAESENIDVSLTNTDAADVSFGSLAIGSGRTLAINDQDSFGITAATNSPALDVTGNATLKKRRLLDLSGHTISFTLTPAVTALANPQLLVMRPYNSSPASGEGTLKLDATTKIKIELPGVAPTVGKQIKLIDASAAVVAGSGSKLSVAALPEVTSVAGGIAYTWKLSVSAAKDALLATLTSSMALPTITTDSLPKGRVGIDYSQTLGVAGNTPITWKVSSGALPDGLSLNAKTGTLKGVPTKVGVYEFVIEVKNAAGSGKKVFSLTINKGPAGIAKKIKIAQPWLRLVVGKKATIGAKVYISGTKDPAAAALQWKSSKPSVLAVNATTGELTAKSVGRANISVTSVSAASDGKPLTGSIIVAVVAKAAAVKSVSATGVPKSIKIGQSVMINGKYSPQTATGIVVKFSSSKPAVATVDSVGSVQGKKVGTAKIKVSANGKSKTYNVKVVK